MMQHPVQPYKGLSPRTAVAKTGVPGGKTTAEKPPENYLQAPQRVPHSTTYLKLLREEFFDVANAVRLGQDGFVINEL